MLNPNIRRWLGISPPVLAIQLVGQEARYLVRHGSRIATQGCIFAPTAIREGNLVVVDELAQRLLPKLPKSVGHVALMLSARQLHLHEMQLPKGLDREELSYQVSRHITDTLGLSLSDVFYDWTVQPELTDKHSITVLLAIARQTDIAPFYHVFAGSEWEMKWVCAEAQIWASAYRQRLTGGGAIAVCQVEVNEMSFVLIEENGHIHSYYKRFDEQQLTQAGFIFHSTRGQDSLLQLPPRFVADEIANALPMWLGNGSIHEIAMIYGVGRGLDWNEGLPAIQSRLGVPLRPIDNRSPSGLPLTGVDISPELMALYHLSKQVRA